MFIDRINSVNRVCSLSFILVFFVASRVLGQVSLHFQPLHAQTSKQGKVTAVSKVELFTISPSELRSALSTDQLTLSLHDEHDMDINLTVSEILSSNHKTRIYTQAHKTLLAGYNKEDIKLFTGSIKGKPTSHVSMTVTPKGMQGTIFNGTTMYFLENTTPAATYADIELMLYNEQDVLDKSFKCLANESNDFRPKTIKKATGQNRSCVEISMAVAVDYFYYQIYDQNISEIIARTMTVMNAAALDYRTAFQDSITFHIVEHFISSCATCDPWGDNKDALVLLDNFSDWAEHDGFSQSFDLGQLWTGGDLQNNEASATIGYAFKGGLCSNKKYHVLEDYSESLWKLRLLASHEIGHNLNCTHDAIGSNTIMSPTVSNTTSWSANSINAVNSFMSTRACSLPCTNSTCDPVADFEITRYTPQAINASWSSQGLVSLTLTDQDSETVLYETETRDMQVEIPGQFSNCQSLQLELTTTCGLESSHTSIQLASPRSLVAEVLDLKYINCIPGSSPSYDIQLIIDHNGIIGEQFFVDIFGQTTSFQFSQTPQTLVIDRAQILYPSSFQEIQLFSIIESQLYCLAQTTLEATPNPNCDLLLVEDFNDCMLPFNWTMTSSNSSYFPYEYIWHFNDDSRKILNYGKGNNAFVDKTISGNCMAYFDDDINSNIDYTGTTILYTENYDVSDFENVNLSFAYLFHSFEDVKGSNNSFFSLQLWSNNSWVEVLRDDVSQCPWSDVWKSECMDFFSINVDAYGQDNLQARFIFSDSNEGDWTGMIAVDNFILSGERILNYGCTNQESNNYDPTATIDDGSCHSCHNAIQDGDETGIDCGGADCDECSVPCDIAQETITTIDKDSTYTNIDLMHVSAKIDKLDVQLKPGKTANFISGFEITKGSTLTAEITTCH